MNRIKLLGFIFGFIGCLIANSQTLQGSTKSSISREKIFTHVDRDFFVCGEIMWFSSTVIDANTNQLSNTSKIGYVELIDEQGFAVYQSQFPFNDGVGHGSIYLSTELKTGVYELVVYTNWLRNFGQYSFSKTRVKLANTLSQKLESAKQVDEDSTLPDTKYDIQLFPEGGTLLEGFESKVAVKVLDLNGKGKDFTGVLLSSSKDTLYTFKSKRFGMSHFEWVPNQDSIECVLSIDGKLHTIEMPRNAKKGVSMKVNRLADSVRIAIRSSGISPTNWKLEISGQNVSFERNVLLDSVYHIIVPLSDFGDGVSRIALKDSDGLTSIRRSFFKPPEITDINVELDKELYSTRSQVHLEMDNIYKGRYSMAVYLLDSLSYSPKGNILSYLYLESELQGFVEEPLYFFKKESRWRNELADLLMLTQEDWTVKSEKFYLPEIEGRLLNSSVSSDSQKDSLLLSMPGNVALVAPRITSYGNRVRYLLPDFNGEKVGYVKNGANLKKENRFENFSPFKVSNSWLNSISNRSLTERSISMQVQNYYFTDSISQLDKTSVIIDSPISSFTRVSYDLNDYVRFPAVDEVLREFVKEVKIRRSRGSFKIRVLERPTNTFFKEPPLVMVNGLPIDNLDVIFKRSALSIKRIDIIDRRFLMGETIHSGVLNFVLEDGAELTDELQGYQELRVKGFQVPRKFYSPTFHSGALDSLPDYRSLLVWEPRLTTSDYRFFTSDIAGDYLIVINGISDEGVPFSTTKRFKVTSD